MTFSSRTPIMLAAISAILGVFLLCACTQNPAPTEENPVMETDTMNHDKDQVVSAQVLLQPASGAAIDGETVITSENIQDFAPSPGAVAAAQEEFVALGFEVGEMVGVSFSITAPVETFEEVFGTSLSVDEQMGVQFVDEDSSQAPELPMDSLPGSLSDHVLVVTFAPPPDFGPDEFVMP